MQRRRKTAYALGLALPFALLALVSAARAQDVAVPAPAAIDDTSTELPSYGARARVRTPEEQPRALNAPEAAQLTEEQGSSFSLLEVMPGAVPVFSGVPYVMVRGAPPSGTRTYYDGVPLPTLFHVALMPALVSPHLLGAMSLYPAVSPARYGQKLGGAFVVDSPALEPGVTTREVELSLLDSSGYLQAPAGDATFAAAWRVGDPSLALAALGSPARLAYYDYQLRYERRAPSGDRLLVLALGAGDRFGDRGAPKDDISLDFQRALVRYTRALPGAEIGSEIMLGYDASTLGQELHGRAARVRPGMYMEWRSEHVRTRVGADLSAAVVSIERKPVATTQGTNALTRTADFTLDPQDFLDQAPLAHVPTRSALGAYGELELTPVPQLTTVLGLRSDLYMAGNAGAAALDPSGRLTYRFSHELRVHAALGLAHAPVASPIPLPGLDDIAFDRGVQSAVQSETGLGIDLGAHTKVDGTLFYDRFLDTVYLELILDCQGNTDPAAAQAVLAALPRATSICRKAGLPRANGNTYGAELYLRQDLSQRLSGFLSYTLSFSDATAADGTHFTPQSDVRHVANLVGQYELGAGWSAGVRVHFRSGKMGVNTIFDVPSSNFTRVEHRLPAFFRTDVHASYRFHTGIGRMEASLSWLNLTFSREATGRDCAFNDSFAIECRVHYQPAIVLPNVALRGEL